MTRARIAIAATDETGSAFASVRQKLDTLGAQASTVTARFSGITAGVLGLLGGATAFGAFIQRTTETVARLKDLQDATGGSIERLSRLVSVSQSAGINFDTVASALTKFNQVLATAREDSPAARVIQRLGLSIAELRKQDPADALVSVARGLERFADNGDRARAQGLLFGDATRRIAPLLKELNAGLSSGTELSSKQAEAYDKLSKSASKLGTVLQEAGVRAASPAVASIQRFLELGDRAKAAGFGGFFDAALSFNTTEFDRLGQLNERLTKIVQRYRDVAQLVEGIRVSGQRVPVELQNQLAALERQESFLRKLQKDLGGGRGDVVPGAPAESIGNFDPTKVQASVSAVNTYVQSLRDQLLATRILGAEETARIAINRGLLGVIDEGGRAQVLALARALDVSRQLRAEEEAAKALKEEGVRLTASLRTEEEKLGDEMARVGALLAARAITQETALRATTRGVMDLKLNLDDIKFPEFARLAEPLRQVSEFAGQAARNIQDALGDSVLQLVKGNAQSIGQIWQDLLQRMVAQALAAKLGEALFGNYGKTGEFGGLLAGLGSLTYGGARANGGPIMAGRAYLVGERGPEVIVPQSSGMVVPNGAVGGVAVSITNNVAAGVTRGELVSALQLTEQQTRANLMRELRAMRVI
jgi:hypothetical protein